MNTQSKGKEAICSHINSLNHTEDVWFHVSTSWTKHRAQEGEAAQVAGGQDTGAGHPSTDRGLLASSRAPVPCVLPPRLPPTWPLLQMTLESLLHPSVMEPDCRLGWAPKSVSLEGCAVIPPGIPGHREGLVLPLSAPPWSQEGSQPVLRVSICLPAALCSRL